MKGTQKTRKGITVKKGRGPNLGKGTLKDETEHYFYTQATSLWLWPAKGKTRLGTYEGVGFS